jgi:hypothetical protein
MYCTSIENLWCVAHDLLGFTERMTWTRPSSTRAVFKSPRSSSPCCRTTTRRRQDLSILTHFVPSSDQLDCSLIVYQCTRAHWLDPPPWPGHSTFLLQLNWTVISQCTGVPVHTRRILLPGFPPVAFSAQLEHVRRNKLGLLSDFRDITAHVELERELA